MCVRQVPPEHTKRAARCVAEAPLRPLAFTPSALPADVGVTLVRAARGASDKVDVLGIEGQAATTELVELAPANDGASAGFLEAGLATHVRCLQDPAFIAAASRAIFGQ